MVKYVLWVGKKKKIETRRQNVLCKNQPSRMVSEVGSLLG